MNPARVSTPHRVGDLLTAAVPALAERILVGDIQRQWADIVGSSLARRAWPAGLERGTLEIRADNSPWLAELQLRGGEILDALRRRHGRSVLSLRFALGARPAPSPATAPSWPRPAPGPSPPRPPRPPAAGRDPSDRAGHGGLRRSRARLGAPAPPDQGPAGPPAAALAIPGGEGPVMTIPRAIALAALLALPGCASMDASGPEAEPPRLARQPVAASDSTATAYYRFAVAQMYARAGRMPEAIAELRGAIESDPKTAALWVQLAQWLARSNQSAEAIAAAQRAVDLEPTSTAAHLTLAELYRRGRPRPPAEGGREEGIPGGP